MEEKLVEAAEDSVVSTYTTKSEEGSRPKIVVSEATLTYGVGDTAVHALGPLDLEVQDGEFLCLVGPSGCGKSTLTKIIAGLLTPTSGTVTVNLRGDSIAPIATVFQDFGIFPWKTVLNNVMFGMLINGVDKEQAEHLAMEQLKKIGLADFADKYPSELSGGMKQRVSIARAMAVQPEILLMDEPFASLDAQLRDLLQVELLRLHESEKRTVIFVTHSLDEAILLGDRVVVLTSRPGTILDAKPVPFPRPRDPAVRDTLKFADMRQELWSHLRDEVRL